MIQREVTDSENTKWTCVQVYSGMNGDKAEKATAISESEEGNVSVVCTPTGGSQSIRLELDKDWTELSDEELLRKISAADKN